MVIKFKPVEELQRCYGRYVEDAGNRRRQPAAARAARGAATTMRRLANGKLALQDNPGELNCSEALS